MYKSLLRKYEINQKNIEKFETISNLIDKTLPTDVPDKKEIQTELSSLKKTLKNQRTEKNYTEKINEEVDQLYNNTYSYTIHKTNITHTNRHILEINPK